ncbi:uncharacterized protein LOC129809293 [Phlebotomus papatasi]|uniref:uncharacterized protein LOC129809293 n=1 Tax=Phlebotomus papatasi TaxID=29031 RepID=UPI0024843921|nr:uncharacterized protein LOC129809293 [Phlebotomus papatasi]
MSNIKCQICDKFFENPAVYIKDLQYVHLFNYGPKTVIKCGYISCSKTFASLKGLKHHMSVCFHGQIPSVSSRSLQPNAPNNSRNDPSTLIEESQLTFSEYYESDVSVQSLEKSDHEELISSLKNFANDIHNFTVSNVVLNFIFTFLYLFLNILFSIIRSIIMSSPRLEVALEKLSEIQTSLTAVVSDSKSTYMRRKNVFSKMPEPEEILLTMKTKRRMEISSKTFLNVQQPVTFAKISLIETLKFVFNLPQTQTLKYSLDENEHDSTLIKGFHDGSVFKTNFNNLNKNELIFISLYFDEFETVNPIGTKIGKHKIGAFYFNICNVQRGQNSKLDHIYLFALIKMEDLKNSDFNDVVKVLIKDLKKLENEGVEINWNGSIKNIKGFLLNICGDNLGLNHLLGFKKNFNSDYFCRICLCKLDEIQYKFREEDFSMRTKETYENDVSKLGNNSDHIRGVRENSLFNDLQYFHVVKNPSIDIMHDVLEGVAQYELNLFFNYLIDHKHNTLHEINSLISSFNFAFEERRNLPSPIRLKGKNHIGQNASQCWTLLVNLPLIFYSHFKNYTDPSLKQVCQLMILLIKISRIIFSYEIKTSSINELKTLIFEHHSLLKKNFPNFLLKAKHHHMIHYPSIILKMGPLVNTWSMRFEGKHSCLKTFAKSSKNFKNIPKSLSIKHQEVLYNKLIKENEKNDVHILSNPTDSIELITQKLNITDEKNDLIFLKHIPNYKDFVSGVFFFYKALNNQNGYFYKILDIFMVQTKYYISAQKYEIEKFDEDLQVYKIVITDNNITIVNFDEIQCKKTFSPCFMNSMIFIVSKVIIN